MSHQCHPRLAELVPYKDVQEKFASLAKEEPECKAFRGKMAPMELHRHKEKMEYLCHHVAFPEVW